MLRLAFDFIITWRETRTRPNAYREFIEYLHLIEIAVRVPFFQQGGRVRPFKAVKQILAHLFITLAQGEQ